MLNNIPIYGWYVDLNGTLRSSNDNAITFVESNGSYSVIIPAVNGYIIQHVSKLVINGTWLTIVITYTPVSDLYILFGNYLSAETGARVIIYSGFIVGSVEIEERNAALSVILNSTSRAALSNLSKYDIKYIVIQSIYLNTTFYGHLITFPASYYMYVGTFDSYVLYEVKANA